MPFDHDGQNKQDAEWTDTWTVSRCEHGGVHLQLDRTCITLTPTEFERLAMMLTQAARKFATEARSEVAGRAH